LSKAVGEATAYWPEGLERSVPVPYEFMFNRLSEVLKNGKMMIRDGQRELSPEELRKLVSQIALHVSTERYASVVCLCSDPLNLTATVLGCFLAGVKVHIDETHSPGLESRLNTISPDVIIVDSATNSSTGRRVIRFEEMLSHKKTETFEAIIRYASYSDPILSLPAGVDAAQHTHTSLLAMVVSFDKFFGEILGSPIIMLGRLSRWHGVLCLASTIFGEGQLYFGPTDPSQVEGGFAVTDTAGLSLLGRELASKLRYVFVAIDDQSRAELKQIYAAGKRLGAFVIPILGCQESGPLIAPHPTWRPHHAIGIPIVNVTPIPIDPETGRMLKIPWHFLERAELGVDTPANMLGYISEEKTSSTMVDGVVRSGYIVQSDANGLFALHAVMR
jgi:acyl-CoA synthetase (AMP-forming)/AMP-acid ligase II